VGYEKIAGALLSGRVDHHELQSTWNRALSLFERGDFAQSIAHTDRSAEIAAAIYLGTRILRELNVPSHLLPPLLIAAGGLQGTFSNFFKHSRACGSRRYEILCLQNRIEALVTRRDRVHQTSSSTDTRRAATAAFENSLAIIQALAPKCAARLSLPV